MSDTAEFAPKQRELARRLLLEKRRSNIKIQYAKLVNRREFSRFSVSRLKLLFQNEWRSMQDEARRIEARNNKVKEEEQRQKNELQKITESEVQRIREEAEKKAHESHHQLVTKTIEELEIEKEKEINQVIKLYEAERAKNEHLSSEAETGLIFRQSVEIDHKIKELAKEIGNRDNTEGWVMAYMARMIQKEVIRLRRAGFKLFKRSIHPDYFLYDNNINTNIQKLWNERCKLSHDPRYCDQINRQEYVLLLSVVWDMLEQVSNCREEESRRIN